MTSAQALSSQPPYWGLQTQCDRAEYMVLRAKFHEDVGKSRKGERLDAFTHRLSKIRQFVQRNDENDWRRCLLCGVFFLKDALAINIQQLKLLLGKCKSSINGSLQQLGYVAQTQTHGIEKELISRIPLNARDMNELKKWTVRRSKEAQPEPTFMIQIPSNLTRKPEQVRKAEEVQAFVHAHYPCPVKCRYKYYDILHQSVSVQTPA